MELQHIINVGLFVLVIIHSIRIYRLEKRLGGKDEKDK